MMIRVLTCDQLLAELAKWSTLRKGKNSHMIAGTGLTLTSSFWKSVRAASTTLACSPLSFATSSSSAASSNILDFEHPCFGNYWNIDGKNCLSALASKKSPNRAIIRPLAVNGAEPYHLKVQSITLLFPSCEKRPSHPPRESLQQRMTGLRLSSYKPNFHPPRSLNFTATLAGDGFRKKGDICRAQFHWTRWNGWRCKMHFWPSIKGCTRHVETSVMNNF